MEIPCIASFDTFIEEETMARWKRNLALTAASLGVSIPQVDKELPFIALYQPKLDRYPYMSPKIRCYPYKKKTVQDNVAETSMFLLCKQEVIYPFPIVQLILESYIYDALTIPRIMDA